MENQFNDQEMNLLYDVCMAEAERLKFLEQQRQEGYEGEQAEKLFALAKKIDSLKI